MDIGDVSGSAPSERAIDVGVTRRDVLKLAAAAFATGAAPAHAACHASRTKTVIVAGGGIAGLCCAYELMKRGHDVTVLEAAGRTGGHVWTVRDGLADGFYVDAGAEHITQPGYERFWKYIDEFGLDALAYPRRENLLRWIDGRFHTEETLADRVVLKSLGFNQREVEFLARRPWSELPLLYIRPYLDAFDDEYNPFGRSLDHLDQVKTSVWLDHEGASAAAIRFIGGPTVSALYRLWTTAILHLRGVPLFPQVLYRLRGGNQTLPNTFAARLGPRVRLGCPVTRIEHNATAVIVTYREYGRTRQVEGDYLVNCIPLTMFRDIPVQPDWSDDQLYMMRNVGYGSYSRVVMQSRTPFWRRDQLSPNIDFGRRELHSVWRTNHEVPEPRGLLLGSADAGVKPADALSAFRRLYPGAGDTIEQAQIIDWSADRWAASCERLPFPLGQLKRFWPRIIEPVGRIYFAGAYADNLNWGMEAATRSAYRVAEQIHAA